MIVQFNFIFQFGPAEMSDIRIFQIQLLCLMRKIEDKKEKKLSALIHSGTLLSNKISISLKINFREETMETNLSASLNQPHKASRETTKPKKHFISQRGVGLGGSGGPALSLIEVGGCIHSCTFSKFLRVNMHLLKWGVPRSTPLHRLCGFLWGAVVTGKINGQGIRGKSTLHCPTLKPAEQLSSAYMARIIELKAV